jgi:N-acetylmuramoyl-L-alanine amidase
MGALKVASLLVLPVLIHAADPPPAELRAELPGGGRAMVRLVFKKGLQVEAEPLPRAFLATRNGGWVGFEELTPEGKRWVLQAVFPKDVWRKEEVRHLVRWPELESVWFMAAAFLGHGQHYDKLMALNPKNPEKLRKDDVWQIPVTLLSADLGGRGQSAPDRSQPEDELDDEAKVAAFRRLLSYEEDDQGKVAVYRLRKGEALYSSVVMRYTDRVHPKDVNDLAQEIAKRSGVEDVRSIPPGTLIRISVAHLADPFQVEGSTRLEEERELRAEVRRTSRIDGGPRLAGVRIVLDAGHGGVDKGAMANGVWESDFVYDISMRVKRLLELDTQAEVSSTIAYPGIGPRPRDVIKTPTHAAEILTRPPFANDGEAPNATSVHLRWVLANDRFYSFGKKGDPQKTLFISFHADSLHPSARGTMAYVPGAASVPASFALGPRRGAAVREMANGSRVVFTPREKLQGEARSRLFSEALLKALLHAKLPVHSNRPIRNVIHRDGKDFIPAVIRHTIAATKVLIEVANLTNDDDADNLRDPGFREKYAEAVVKAIRAYFRK